MKIADQNKAFVKRIGGYLHKITPFLLPSVFFKMRKPWSAFSLRSLSGNYAGQARYAPTNRDYRDKPASRLPCLWFHLKLKNPG